MRIALWHQFSSNHSNSFIVVGKFATVDNAHTAYLHVRRAMRRIIEAHQRSNPNFVPIPNETSDQTPTYFPTPIELEVFAPYGIVPEHMADWTTYRNVDAESIHKAVRRFENYVFVADPAVGYAGSEPWDRLLGGLGGQIQKAEETEEATYIGVDIQCKEANMETAARMYGLLTADFDNQPLPWLPYAYDNPAELQALEAQYLIWRRWDKQQRRLNHQLDTMPKRDRDAFREVVAHHQGEMPFELDTETHDKILQCRRSLEFQKPMADISIDSEGQIICRNLVFGDLNCGLALPALVAWMRGQGCEVSYAFRRTKFRRETTLIYRAADTLAASRILEKLRALQTDQPHLPTDRESNVLLTSRDRLSQSFDEITIILYDSHTNPVHNFFRANKCRRASAESKMIEIPLGET